MCSAEEALQAKWVRFPPSSKEDDANGLAPDKESENRGFFTRAHAAFSECSVLVTHPAWDRRMGVRFPPLRLTNRVRPKRPYKQSVSKTEHVGSNPTMATIY